MKENIRSLKYSIPASSLAGLIIVIVNRLLQTPLTTEEVVTVSVGLTVAINYAIDLAYRKFKVS